jgi:hypothetical protein
MMYAAYCSGLRDNKQLSESDKTNQLLKYNQELMGALLQKQSEIEKGYGSSNAAERAVAIRNAFEGVSIFGVRLEPDWSLVGEKDKQQYITNLPRCENIIARPIGYYSKESGKFSESENLTANLQGQVSGQSIRFGGLGYGGVSFSGNLVSSDNDWIFRGSVTCGQNRYKGVFQLR